MVTNSARLELIFHKITIRDADKSCDLGAFQQNLIEFLYNSFITFSDFVGIRPNPRPKNYLNEFKSH